MKYFNTILIFLGIIGLFYLYQYFFPNIQIKTKYVKGKPDTIIVVKDSIRTIVDKQIIVKTDTVYIDSSGEHAQAHFNLEDSTVTGIVKYDTPKFSFWDVKIKHKIINNYITQTDTVIRTKYKTNKFHIGVVGGYGIGIQTRQPDFFIGIGFSWELL